ncbi:hypothetical protein Tco_0195918 [Tanacetum coccineum]
MECVSTASYSISINGDLHGYFKEKRGLRQGDPLSPYLFTLVREVLTLMLHRRVRNAKFTYHRYCSRLNLINLCFADDLFLFAHGDAQSTCVIKEALEEFKHASGLRKGKSKVAWELVCLPRDEGGLGLRRLDCFNKALIVSHLWNLISMKESLWVKWVHAYKLRGRSFWDVPIRGEISWGWRKVLQLRPLIREFVWHNIGDGALTSLWFDRWCPNSPLANTISTQDIHRAGLNLDSRVCDIVQNDGWSWPDYLVSKYPFLDQIVMPNRSHRSDAIEWRDETGVVKPFSVSMVWEAIRHRHVKVPWSDIMWFSSSIPRHACHLWLVFWQRLKTQDRIRNWELSGDLSSTCTLCETQMDTHEHLFFECSFSQQVLYHMKMYADIASDHVFSHIVADLLSFANRRSSRSVISKLVVAACAYFIWQERNSRLFKKKKRLVKQVADCIYVSIRLKLLSSRFKRSTESLMFARLWQLPDSIFK